MPIPELASPDQRRGEVGGSARGKKKGQHGDENCWNDKGDDDDNDEGDRVRIKRVRYAGIGERESMSGAPDSRQNAA